MNYFLRFWHTIKNYIFLQYTTRYSNTNPFFRSFDLEDSDFCNTDYVEIHENDPSGPLIGKYCGNRIPSNVTTAHKLWIKFRSDDFGTSAGFLAYYSIGKFLTMLK